MVLKLKGETINYSQITLNIPEEGTHYLSKWGSGGSPPGLGRWLGRTKHRRHPGLEVRAVLWNKKPRVSMQGHSKMFPFAERLTGQRGLVLP